MRKMQIPKGTFINDVKYLNVFKYVLPFLICKMMYRLYSRLSRPAHKPTPCLGWTLKVEKLRYKQTG